MSDEERPTSSRTHKGKRAKDGIETDTSDDDASGSTYAARMFRALFRKLSITKDSEDEEITTTKVIEELTIEGLTRQWKEKGFTKIVTMVGAGISTSAGIPDFRSPGSGLYDNLQKYDLPHPTAVFEMDYFLENPLPFFTLAKELYPGVFHPTPSHYFVRLLHEKGLLVRHYTQNIDTLERIAGIPEHKLVEAHGSFYTGHCLTCHNIYTMEWMKEQIFLDIVPKCTMCSGIVKPDIIFFGENLPDRFYKLPPTDFADCDLLIIMGTSLEVQPFASLTDHVGSQCVRLLINRTKVGSESGLVGSWFGSTGLMFDSIHNTRDIAYIGDCDDGVWKLAEGLGWTEELMDLIAMETARLTGGSIDEEQSEGASSSDKGLEDKLENKPKIPVELSVEPEQPIAKGTHSSRSSHKSAWSDRQLSPKKKSRSPSPSGRKSPRRKAQKNKKKP